MYVKERQPPPDVMKFVVWNRDEWVWRGDAMLTLRGDKMEQIKNILAEEHNIHVKIDVDVIYRLLDRIYDLEKRIKKLEKFPPLPKQLK
jgi:hypothetical protein